MKKLKWSVIGAAILGIMIIIFVQIYNFVKATSISELVNSGSTSYSEGVPIYVEDIETGLGDAMDYAVFANTFNQITHMEGNIAVKNAYIGAIFNFTNNVLIVNNELKSYSITVYNEINGVATDDTFSFGIYTLENGEYVQADYDVITITTEGGTGTATFSGLDANTTYYIFELDDDGSIILDNAITSDGVTVTYGNEKVTVSSIGTNYENTSYIENIESWQNGAASGNDADNPKLVIPMSLYEELEVVDHRLCWNGSVVLYNPSEGEDLELIVIDVDGQNYTVVYNSDEDVYELQSRDNDYEIIDFESDFDRLNQFSTLLANVAVSSDEVTVINLDANGSIYDSEGNVNGLNSGNANSATLDLSKYLEDGKFLIINVDTSGLDTLYLENTISYGTLTGTWAWNEESTRVLWNFYNKDTNTPFDGTITIGKNTLIGTFLAPSAEIVVGATINGSVIADTASNPGGEIHKSQFNLSKKTVATTVYNTKATAIEGSMSININKIDSSDKTALANATFKIIVKNGDTTVLETTEVTDSYGNINISDIELEGEGITYTIIVEELVSPEGYNLVATSEFNVTTILQDGKYVLQPATISGAEGTEISVENDLIDITVQNSKVEGTFNIQLTKVDSNDNSVINGIVFDIEVQDEDGNDVIFIDNITEDEINLEGLVTGDPNEDGIIRISNIKIEETGKYTLILTEHESDNYAAIDPIKINVETVLKDGEYALGDISLADDSTDDVSLSKDDNIICLTIKNTKEVKGTYNIKLQKINSISLVGLSGVKFHISIYDNENNSIVDGDMITYSIDGKDGYINIDNISVTKEGIHRCEITEIESLDGYEKFEQTILAEIEFVLNDSGDGYEIKSVTNIGVTSENLTIEKEDGTNNVLIVLANDPSEDSEESVDNTEKQKEEESEEEVEEETEETFPSILPQTGVKETLKIIVILLLENAIICGIYFAYRRKSEKK